MEDLIEFQIKTHVECLIRETVSNEINKKVEEFREQLENRKDTYIAEIMKGIRIVHERDAGGLGVNYKIIFENIYKIEQAKEVEE